MNFCKEFIKKYTKRLGISYCSGLPIIPSKNPSDKDLVLWGNYHTNNYDNKLLSSNWDHDLLCVILGKKPTALIDNDHMRNYDNQFDYYLRYMAEKCGIRKLTMLGNNDPTNIYYKSENWKDAILLYLYHENESIFPDEIINMDHHGFNCFQGILLGYTKESVHDYEINYNIYKTAYGLIDKFKKYANDMTSGKKFEFFMESFFVINDDDGSSKFLEKVNYKFNIEELRILYNEYWKIYSENSEISFKHFERINSIIEDLKKKLDENPIFEAYARANKWSKDITFKNFGKRKSKKRSKGSRCIYGSRKRSKNSKRQKSRKSRKIRKSQKIRKSRKIRKSKNIRVQEIILNKYKYQRGKLGYKKFTDIVKNEYRKAGHKGKLGSEYMNIIGSLELWFIKPSLYNPRWRAAYKKKLN